MILETTIDMYKAFLDGIKKSHQGTVSPDAFNRLINDWGQDEFMSKYADQVELTQKEIDKISVLRVITDNIFKYSTRIDGGSAYALPPIPVSSINNYFNYPFDKDTTISSVLYPAYRRFGGVQFQLQYINDRCNRAGYSEYKSAKVLKSDQRTILYSNNYRKPNEDRLYFYFSGKDIVLDCGQRIGIQSKGVKMILEYYRYPRKIFFDTQKPTTEQIGTPVYTVNTGCVNCEFPGYVKKEIVDIAVRNFLERSKDPRYQSFLNEIQIKS